MSARDLYHSLVVKALEKDGWVITNDPLFLNLVTASYTLI